MSDNEHISNTFSHFTDILNALRALSRDMPNVELLNEILPSLLHSWELKVTVNLEAKDLTKLKLDQLIASIIKHEMITSNDEKEKERFGPKSFSA